MSAVENVVYRCGNCTALITKGCYCSDKCANEADQFEDDEDEGKGVYCECGAHHDMDERDSNKCSCCGLPIDWNGEPA